MKIIPAETMVQMQALFDSGYGIRATARALGLHRDTVLKYYRQGEGKLCQCGRPLTHKGWCSTRVARSPARQTMLRQTFGRSLAVGQWNARAELDAQRVAFFDVRARLESAWVKQAIMRENLILGAQHMIGVATEIVRKRIRAPLIADDVVQDLIVLMLEGKMEAGTASQSPLVGRCINYEFGLLWASGQISMTTDADERPFEFADERNMTKEDFMACAWRDFILWAHEEPHMRDAFAAHTGLKFPAPAANALDAAIDDATGIHSKVAAEFVKWVTINHWGLDEAPEEYRQTLAQQS